MGKLSDLFLLLNMVGCKISSYNFINYCRQLTANGSYHQSSSTLFVLSAKQRSNLCYVYTSFVRRGI